ncbi:unnamed protein product [Didymodactylos carnosus]|uniref:Pentatricopeptide repeat-containing protein n=1 Tax=Didymodactylos carnosus TaxID=1234261 RepID=A0A814WB30_9BILA|nr:unnamed protein product [Didymodactylos carnosus]CAF3967183.1 unnamed protein product [Didymodactylos carnosus]
MNTQEEQLIDENTCLLNKKLPKELILSSTRSNLEFWDISWCTNITEGEIRILAESCPKLTSFKAEGYTQMTNNAAIELGKNCSNLLLLDLNRCPQMKKLNDNGQFEKALTLYEDQIEKQNKQSTNFTIDQVLKACIELGDIKRAKDIHNKLSPTMANNSFIQSNLIRLYSLVDNNRCEEALKFFREINITPSEFTFSILFKICTEIADQRSLEFGKLIFDRMPKKFYNNIVIITSALQMFLKCGDISTAEELFNRIQNKNLIVFTVMMKGFVLNKMEERAIDLFFKIDKPNKIILSIFFKACAQLKSEKALTLGKKVFNKLVIESNQSNVFLYSVLNMFIQCDDLKSAESLFDRINRDIISYGSMMKFSNVKDQPEKTLELFQRMKKDNLNPNEIIFVHTFGYV